MAYRLDTSGPLGVAYNVSAALSGGSSGTPTAIPAKDFVIRTDSSGGNVFLGLPRAENGGAGGSPLTGKMLLIIKSDTANTVTIKPDSNDGLNGGANTIAMTLGGAATWLYCDGSDWFSVAKETGDEVGYSGGSTNDNNVARYHGTTGQQIQSSGVSIDDSNNVTGVAVFTATSVTSALTAAHTITLGGDLTGSYASTFASGGGATLTATIAAASVENSMLADDAVGADELAADAVVNASIASNAAIDMDKLDGDSLAATLSGFEQDDLFIMSDTSASGALKSITASYLEDAIFGNVSGDASIAAGGALTIAAASVENSMLADDAVGADELAANAVVNASVASGAAIAFSKLAALASAKLLVGDGSNVPTAVTLSGDATLSNAGVLTIAASAVEGTMLNNNVISGQTELVHANIADADEMLFSDGGTLKKVGVDSLRDHYFGVVSGGVIIADGGAATLSTEVLQDNTGAMFSGNTETFIAATYQDGDGTIDLVVPVLDEDAFGSNSAAHLATQQSIKAYVDGVASGLDVKASVVAATTASFTMASSASSNTLVLADGEGGFSASGDSLTMDGISVPTLSRVLIKDTVNSAGAGAHGKWNGIYTVGALSGSTCTLTRATDFDSTSEVTGGAFTFIEQGTANADQGFVCSNDAAITIGSTAISFSQFSGAGQITAGNGLTKSGNTINVVPGTLLDVQANQVDVDLTEAAAATVAHDDHLLFLDGGASGAASKGSTHDLANLFAGSGLTATNSVIAVGTLNQSTSGNAATATLATTFTCTDNESADEDCTLVFVDGATGAQGAETDGDLHYNPSTGLVTATRFAGALTGYVTGSISGNAAGTAATVTSGTQAAITTCSNLVTVGTIGSGTWQGGAIADSYVANDLTLSSGTMDGYAIGGTTPCSAELSSVEFKGSTTFVPAQSSITSSATLASANFLTQNMVSVGNATGSVYDLTLPASGMEVGQRWYIKMIRVSGTANDAPVRIVVPDQSGTMGTNGVVHSLNNLAPDSNSPQGGVWFLYDQTSFNVGTIDGDNYYYASGMTETVEISYAGSYPSNNNTYHLWRASAVVNQGQNTGYSGGDQAAVCVTKYELLSPITQLHKDDEGELALATSALAGNLDMDANSADRDGKTIILVDTSSARTIKLPDANEVASGRIFIIKDKTGGASTNPITITSDASIDGIATGGSGFQIDSSWASIQLICDGTNWFIL